MRISLAILLPVITVAAPTQRLGARQVGHVGYTADELINDPCKPIILVFARGSTQPGNLASKVVES